MQAILHCFISGRVQGVFFRDFTRKQAMQYHLTGFAKNLSDGRVEVLACGEETGLQQLKQWLHQGSPMASVDKVECQKITTAITIPTNFTIG